MTLDLGAPASVMARLSAGVRDDQLGDPTPCEETDVAGMLAHIIGFSVAFRDGAAKVGGPTTSTPPGPVTLPDDWREQLPLRVERAGRGVARPVRLGGRDDGGRRHPAGAEHRRVRQRRVGPARLGPGQRDRSAVRGGGGEPGGRLAAGLEHSRRSGRPSGLFGPRLPIADDAPLLDRVLAYAGRDPTDVEQPPSTGSARSARQPASVARSCRPVCRAIEQTTLFRLRATRQTARGPTARAGSPDSHAQTWVSRKSSEASRSAV